MIERAVGLAETSMIGPEDLPIWQVDTPEDDPPPAAPPALAGVPMDLRRYKATVMSFHMRSYVQYVYEYAGGVVTKAAELAGVSRSNFQVLMSKHGLRS